MTQKYLYIPLEIVVREMDGRALLGAVAAMRDRGWITHVGKKRALVERAASLPEGVFLLKSATPNELPLIKSLADAGHSVCVQDEEGLVTYTEAARSNIRYSDETMQIVKRMFLWGPHQRDGYMQAVPKFAEKGFMTGHPRSDFWRHHAAEVYAPWIKKLKEQYGRFIFVPTSFGMAVHFSGEGRGMQMVEGMARDALTTDIDRIFRTQTEMLYVTFREYFDYLPKLAAQQPDVNFIIRPHPSESHDMWRQLETLAPNIKVVYEGAVTPWILAAEGLIHYRSTTSVEGFLMNRPVMTYVPPMPEYLSVPDLKLVNAVTHSATSRAEMSALIEKLLTEGGLPQRELPQEMRDNWICEQPGGGACDLMLDQIEQVVPTPTRGFGAVSTNTRQVAKRKLGEVLTQATKNPTLARLMPDSFKKRAEVEQYGQHKEVGMDLEVVQRIVDHIAAVHPNAAEAKDSAPTAVEAWPGMFRISRPQ